MTASNVPSQVHIALAGRDNDGNSNKIAVSWSTVAQSSTSVVKYGTSKGTYTESASGYSRSYYETFHNHVVLNTLTPNTVYYYVVGNDADGWSSELSFTSAPLSSNLRGNFSFGVFGDLGVVSGGPTNTYLTNARDDLQFIVHAGDIGYADDSFLHKGCYTSFCYEDAYDTYMKNIQPWASKLPYMVAPGNHEAGNCFFCFFFHFSF